MKNKKKLIIFVLLFLVIVLLLYLFLSNKPLKKELEFIVNSYDLEIKVGNEVPIDYQINEDINITWKSDNDSVVTINNGVITGVGLGDTVVTGTATKGENAITRSINVSTYEGDKNVSLNEIVLPVGELFITVGSTYKIDYEYSPKEAYIKSIEYQVSDNNIIEYQNGLVTAKSVGTTNLTINVNNSITKMVTVNVIEKNITPTFSKKVEDINVISSITLKPNETKEIPYSVIPEDAFIENVKWESNNENIVTINDGIAKGLAIGEATIKLIINGNISKEISVKVNTQVTGIRLDSNPNIVLKVGEKETIKVVVEPSNATNKKVKYISSSNNVSINENGIVTALAKGSGTIRIITEDGNKEISVSYTINSKIGLINGTGGVWGYTSKNDKVPIRAEKSFFQKLVSSGKGTLSGNVYIYNDGKNTYKYDISSSTLNVANKTILMRIYYPDGVDLTSVNTFTFLGGVGELNFSGFFNHLDKNRSDMKSSGIIILVSGKNRYSSEYGIYSTNFVKSILNQKKGVKNAVGGYSMSGPSAGYAMQDGNYDRLIIFDTSIDNTNRAELRNKEIIVYSPVGDALTGQTIGTLRGMINGKYSNVTVVSNNNEVINCKTGNISCSAQFLVINPGEKMGKGHGYVNIIKANVFSYACR